MTAQEGRAHYRKMTRRDLTARQREVLALIAEGLTNAEIGERLGITLDGAKYHVAEILERLGVGSREAAAEWWREQNRIASRLRGAGAMVAGISGWKWAIGVAGAVAAVAAGAAVAVLVGTAEDGGTPVAPAEASATPSVPPEPTPTQGPVIHGRFEILPPVADPRPCTIRVPPGLAQDRVEVFEGSLDEVREHQLYFAPPPLPAGWELFEAHTETVVWSDGSRLASIFALAFQGPGGTATISRLWRDDDCTTQVGPGYSTGFVGGERALFHDSAHQRRVMWYRGNILTVIESNALDMATLQGMAASLVQVPMAHGRFEIVPEGSPLEMCSFRGGAEVWRPYSWAQRGSVSQVRLRYSQLDEGYPLYVRAPALPAGWDLIEFRSDMTLFTNAAVETTAFGLAFEDQNGGSIVILRMLREPGCTVQVAGPFGTGKLGDTEAVFHMEKPWSIHWFNGDVLTMVWSDVWDVDALMPVAVEVYESLAGDGD